MAIERRKDDHIRIALEKDIFSSRNYWDDVMLPGRSIPAADLDDIIIQTVFLGKRIEAPFMIASMTGGSPQAKEYNDLLARAAADHGIPLGVGSQRAGLERPEYVDSYSVVREYDIPLVFANIGLPQFSKRAGDHRFGKEDVQRALDMIDADAVCVHLNYLQEVVQPEGDCHISGALTNLKELCGSFDVIAKETGGGISREDGELLKDIGVKAIDVGGLSGTTFSAVESFRHDPTGRSERLGKTLWNWGIPTPLSLKLVKDIGLPLISTGGIRDGLDVSRSLALGASISGIAWKFLKAASSGYDELFNEISMIKEEVRSVAFLSGVKKADELFRVKPMITGKLAEIIK